MVSYLQYDDNRRPHIRPDFLDDHFTRHGLRSRSSRKHIPQGLRSATPYGTVLDIWNAHQDASDPRKVLNQLKDRRRFPWKTLAFDQHIRPPYSGTFTKKSAVVGPRTPLAQDPIFDYTYDSGDDWQDDGGGDDVDDFDEAAGQEESDEEESDGEFDDWLDDAEDEHYVPMDIVAEDMPVQTDVVPPSIERTPLGLKAIRKPREVPKRSVKISPYWRGPIWESEVGERIEGFGDYRLQLLNGEHFRIMSSVNSKQCELASDTPGSVNPFTYIASSPKDTLKGQYSTIVVGNNLSVRCLLSTDVVTIDKKCTPGRLVGVETVHATSTSDGDSSSVTRALPKRPKVAFPTAHLPELLRLIEGNPKTRNDLVSQLKAHFDSITSKAAIEAKIREVASRQGQAKDSQWRVRPEAWVCVSSDALEPAKILAACS